MPTLLRTLAQDVVAAAGLEVLDRVVGDDELDEAVGQLAPDVVLSGLDRGGLSPACARVLETYGLRIVALAANGRSGAIYEPSSPPRPLRELSLGALLAALVASGFG